MDKATMRTEMLDILGDGVEMSCKVFSLPGKEVTPRTECPLCGERLGWCEGGARGFSWMCLDPASGKARHVFQEWEMHEGTELVLMEAFNGTAPGI
jgi:hypothetical protein